MRKPLLKCLALALCAALLCVPASALLIAQNDTAPVPPGPTRVWGTLTKLENNSFRLENSDESDPYREIVLHGADALYLDAVTGGTMSYDQLKDGEIVYAYMGPAVAASLPPQGAAQLVLANIPADFAVPTYYEIQDATLDGKGVTIQAEGDLLVTVPASAEFFPYLTKNIVGPASLVPGARILAWTGADNVINRVMVFAYGYRAWVELGENGAVSANGERLTAVARDGLLPIRALAEAAGYAVSWDDALGARVVSGDVACFSVLPGAAVAKTPAGDVTLSAPCVYAAGATYLPAADLAELLNLYLVP